jgi:hypothetical protein
MADSFSSKTGKEVPHDYESDAIVVHMGAFAAPALLGSSNSKGPQGIPTTTDDSNPSGDDEDSCEEPPPVLSAQQQAAAARGAGKPTARSQRAGRRGSQAKPDRSQLVQLYSIAAPGMRHLAHDTAELSVCTAWCQPVRARPDWSQVQKDYFQAPGVYSGSKVLRVLCGPLRMLSCALCTCLCSVYTVKHVGSATGHSWNLP